MIDSECDKYLLLDNEIRAPLTFEEWCEENEMPVSETSKAGYGEYYRKFHAE
jgi:hypothetical protein|tara:strand:+ start:247 stop:402 length:156 start_codon:yes stop_codon:yes gene_type:complete